jgi:Chalcone isomerase-like
MTHHIHIHRRAALIALAGLALAPWPRAMRAAEGRVLVEGAAFDRQLALLGSELRLNGTGVRAVAWFKAYAVGLYLTAKAATAAQAVAAPGPKRLRMHMLTEAPAKELSKALRKGLMRNAGGASGQTALEARIAAIEDAIDVLGKVHKADVIDLDFDPARGTLLMVNGTLRHGPTAGDDFYAALLRAFVGDQPYDDKMRDGLLGQPA